MASYTTHYGFAKLGEGDSLSEGDYQFTTRDRDEIDRLLYLGAEGHKHRGNVATNGPTVAPVPVLYSVTGGGGYLPPSTRVYYRYSYLDTEGVETAVSPEAYVDTLPQLGVPAAMYGTGISASTGGFLPAGSSYWYALTAYQGANTNETLVGAAVSRSVPGVTNTNIIYYYLPAAMTNADGYNVYRRRPGQANYYYLTSHALAPGTPAASVQYFDTGSVAEDCDRVLPSTNTTMLNQRIIVSLPGATPTPPATGWWKLYRTILPGDYTKSFLANISGSATYVDVGNAPNTGSPLWYPTGNPEKVILTDGMEVDGTLPPGMTAFPQQINFNYEGPVSAVQGTSVWICDYAKAEVVAVRAALGRGSTPAVDPVIVDVNKNTNTTSTPNYTSIFTTQTNRPFVPAGR